MKSQKWRDKLADKTLTLKLAEIQAGPEWGNCRRGCPPAYLNKNGFCSPACELGGPRGEFVTIREENHIALRG